MSRITTEGIELLALAEKMYKTLPEETLKNILGKDYHMFCALMKEKDKKEEQ